MVAILRKERELENGHNKKEVSEAFGSVWSLCVKRPV